MCLLFTLYKELYPSFYLSPANYTTGQLVFKFYNRSRFRATDMCRDSKLREETGCFRERPVLGTLGCLRFLFFVGDARLRPFIFVMMHVLVFLWVYILHMELWRLDMKYPKMI